MKFQKYLEENQISLWKDFYLNYSLLKKILKPMHKLYKMKLRKVYLNILSKQIQSSSLKNPLLDLENELNFLDESLNAEDIANQFHNQIILEIKKVEHFFKETLDNRIITRLKEIKEQIEFAKLHLAFDDYSKTFELAIKQLYREVSLLKDYVDLNLKAKGKILKKFHKIIKMLLGEKKNSSYNIVDEEIEDFINSYGLKDYDVTLNKILYDLTKLFSNAFSGKYKDSSSKILKNSIIVDQFSLLQSF
jgi:SPX domain protein involved in polyphosphate accumulation